MASMETENDVIMALDHVQIDSEMPEERTIVAVKEGENMGSFSSGQPLSEAASSEKQTQEKEVDLDSASLDDESPLVLGAFRLTSSPSLSSSPSPSSTSTSHAEDKNQPLHVVIGADPQDLAQQVIISQSHGCLRSFSCYLIPSVFVVVYLLA